MRNLISKTNASPTQHEFPRKHEYLFKAYLRKNDFM